jgi:hypothetical protein
MTRRILHGYIDASEVGRMAMGAFSSWSPLEEEVSKYIGHRLASFSGKSRETITLVYPKKSLEKRHPRAFALS